MKDRYRLHRRANGMYCLHNRLTNKRESLHTKDEATALKLIQTKNQAFSQPTFNREMAKVFLKAQDPKFCERTWQDVANLIDAAYEGSTKSRFGKFVRSVPMHSLVNLRLPYPSLLLDAAKLAMATAKELENYEHANIITVSRRSKSGEIKSINFNGRRIRLSTIRQLAHAGQGLGVQKRKTSGRRIQRRSRTRPGLA